MWKSSEAACILKLVSTRRQSMTLLLCNFVTVELKIAAGAGKKPTNKKNSTFSTLYLLFGAFSMYNVVRTFLYLRCSSYILLQRAC